MQVPGQGYILAKSNDWIYFGFAIQLAYSVANWLFSSLIACNVEESPLQTVV